jgi:nucleoside-diphosphate-sugar epimerase
MAKLVVGCGYLGLRVARLWRDAGEDVVAVTRSSEKADRLADEGLTPIVADVSAAPFAAPPEIETVLFAVGFDRVKKPRDTPSASRAWVEEESRDDQSIHDVYVGGLRNAIRSLKVPVQRFIYISSTGVYGQVAGTQVDESSPCQPTREGGQASLDAEGVLSTSDIAKRSIILRLAGLYGPGRIPRAADLLAGKPIDAPMSGYLNLIHVDDAARMVLLAEAQAPVPALYVVSDGHPVVRGDYYRELARLLGAPSVTFIKPTPGSSAAARAGSDKRVNPRRLFSELAPALLYPCYRDGLAAIVAGESQVSE